MKMITLQFHSFDELWDFKQITNTVNFKINTVLLTLTAEFNAGQIALAVASFRAVKVESKVA